MLNTRKKSEEYFGDGVHNVNRLNLLLHLEAGHAPWAMQQDPVSKNSRKVYGRAENVAQLVEWVQFPAQHKPNMVA